MNQAMWANSATQDNLQRLRQRGVHILGPAAGSQACGEVGLGRMLEPLEIAELSAGLFETGSLAGRKLVITAGPTREALDPVRYLSNHSSGKMGYALAQAAAEAGARVVLISGPTQLQPPPRVTMLAVTSAVEMCEAALAAAADCDMFIAAAAVADYRPARRSEQKIKKTADDTFTLELVKNPDIVAAVAALRPKPYTVGFAAESEQLLVHARDKLVRKGLDLIIANNIAEPGIGFDSDENAVTLLDAHSEEVLSRRSKSQLARDLVARLAARLSR